MFCQQKYALGILSFCVWILVKTNSNDLHFLHEKENIPAPPTPLSHHTITSERCALNWTVIRARPSHGFLCNHFMLVRAVEYIKPNLMHPHTHHNIIIIYNSLHRVRMWGWNVVNQGHFYEPIIKKTTTVDGINQFIRCKR